MQFTVLDVGHGACAFVQDDNANLMLFDCGHKTDPELRPSSYLRSIGHQSVEILFISNYDQDHISDLPRLRGELKVRSLSRNGSISAAELRALKLRQSGEISPAMDSMLDMIGTYTRTLNPAPEFPGVTYNTYYNDHPFGNGDDTNNIREVAPFVWTVKPDSISASKPVV